MDCIPQEYIVQDAFISIARNVRFHVSCEQIHDLLPPSFQSSHSHVDIMLLTNGIYIFIDILSLPIPPEQIWFLVLLHFVG